jgi:uncharacterized protein
MNYRWFALFCVLILAVPLMGVSAGALQMPAGTSSSALPADAPSRDQVMTLMDLLQVRRNMQQMMGGMKQAMKAGALQALKRDVRDPSQKQIDKINVVVEAAFEDMRLEDFIDVMIPIYQRHLSKADVEEMIRFYTSPTGQKLLREQPQMIQESMQAAQKVQEAKIGKVMDNIERRIKEFTDDDSAATAPSGKK